MDNKIKVKVNGGYIVAERNPDPNYDGITVYFESDDGDIVDIVWTESRTEDDKQLIRVYCYEDVYDETCTSKFTLDTAEIYKALYE